MPNNPGPKVRVLFRKTCSNKHSAALLIVILTCKVILLASLSTATLRGNLAIIASADTKETKLLFIAAVLCQG